MDISLLHKIDRDIATQLKTLGIGEKRPQKHLFPSITISREFGCEATPLAQLLVKKLSTDPYPWVMFHRKLITEITEKEEIQKDIIESIGTWQRGKLHQYIEHLLIHKPGNLKLYKKIAEAVRILAEKGRSVILGAGAAIITSEMPRMLHVRLQAPLDFRVKRVSRVLEISETEAKEVIRDNDLQREAFVYEFTRKNIHDPSHYDLIFDNSKFNAEQITELIHSALLLRNMLPKT